MSVRMSVPKSGRGRRFGEEWGSHHRLATISSCLSCQSRPNKELRGFSDRMNGIDRMEKQRAILGISRAKKDESFVVLRKSSKDNSGTLI